MTTTRDDDFVAACDAIHNTCVTLPDIYDFAIVRRALLINYLIAEISASQLIVGPENMRALTDSIANKCSDFVAREIKALVQESS